ncbi:Heterokaryon incompatibility protein 6, OR allele [Colletotrichum fructicola Nara gc5]|uniref:Heterokaryon incompatibility protein 6, OR allele n=1 Tax=Colletotrichum fructicola (strain Nara gc5) TaxID=1213859 RepID=A0A7J6IEN0_COLFN|nr:Heterokaryon incompatibility protein 6, OR allele [Colletotrichum fructicola Nara gc5]KAF4881391.1 Heterokaryon incompatibility protein 6, OR allele [Colletotrichum fructicola]
MDHRNCTIAWVLPSSKYHTTAEAFFDEVYNHFSTPLRMTYSIGRVGRHDVVAASKTNDATSLHTRDLVDNLLGDFPFIRAGFLASVDAIASTTGPIRVGDVVVGTKPNLQSAVVYFDAKQTQSQQRLVLTREPRRIPECVAMAIESVRTQKGRDAWLEALGETSQRNQRKAYRGAIGSSSEAFNDAIIIDRIVSKHNILCFETTAASIDSHSLVVVASVSRHAGGSESPTSAAQAHGAVFSYLRCVTHYMSAGRLRIEPPLASYFTYTPFDLDRAYFRLLILHKGRKHDKISCSVFQACLPNRQSQEEKEIIQNVETILPYGALSYCWGDDRLRNMITVDGKALFITDSLLDALQNLRRTEEDRILWVDAICIDQSNVEERGHQVGWMGELYRRAEEVLCWLGDTEHNVSHLLALLEDFRTQVPRVAWTKWPITDDRWRQVWKDVSANQSQHDYPSQLKCLMAKEWFSRVWILQEVANARKAAIGCSEGWISAKAFAIAPTLLDVRPSNQCQAVIDIMPGPTRRQFGRAQKTNICSLLWAFRESQASDPRDRLYALLGLASDLRGKEGSIVADYTKAEEAVTEDILSYLYQDDTSISTTRQLGLARVQADIPELSGMALEKIVSARLDVGKVQEYMQRENTMIWLTEGIARIAAQDICSGEKIVELLLSERANVMVTEGLVKVIASSFSSTCTRLLLEHQGQDIQVTSQIVKAAAENESSGEQVMNLLLVDQRVKFTDGAVEEVTMAAAGSWSSGAEVMRLLLDRRGEGVKVTGGRQGSCEERVVWCGGDEAAA